MTAEGGVGARDREAISADACVGTRAARLRITFVLPALPRTPVGGFRVAFEYCDRLAERGHAITILHPFEYYPPVRTRQRIHAHLWAGLARLGRVRVAPWYTFRRPVRLVGVPDLRAGRAPAADVVVATSWTTAEHVAHYTAPKGRRYYNVYDYEHWKTADEATRQRMAATYRGDFRLIATSPAVREMLAENGVEPAAYIPCGVDLGLLGVDVPIEERPAGVVGFPLRAQEYKGAAEAIEACRRLRERRGEGVRFRAFGPRRLDALPSWVEFVELPSDGELRGFYNSVSVFMFPSHVEGWGLPGHEALACGAAVVAADSVGLRDYAMDGETALLVPPRRADLLADAVERLLCDDALRQTLARQGHAHVQQFTWKRAVDALENLFLRDRCAAA